MAFEPSSGASCSWSYDST